MSNSESLSQAAINTIRFLSVDGVQKANAGHPGAPMGLAAPAYVLWTRFLKHNPADPAWPNRDRFILSPGHASMLLYSLLHLTGYDLPLQELKQFRQFGSLTPGHPEFGLTPGVETTTGPLGQGFANGVGMAIAQAHMAATFNRAGYDIVDHYVYGIVSDGDLMEGIAAEAASLAGHLRLGRLIYLYDDNHITIEGKTEIAFTEDRMARFRAYGWHTQQVKDGNDLEAVAETIRLAKSVTDRPSIIAVRTHIGYGSPNKQDTPAAHGAPLGPDEVLLTKENLDWPVEPTFYIPDEVEVHFREALATGADQQEQWQAQFDDFALEHPNLAAEWKRRMASELPKDWDADVPLFEPGAKGVATRNASGMVLNALANRLPELMGGSADLAPSTKTLLKNSGDFEPGAYENRNMRFGVREHAMAAILNGMSLYGGLRPFGATFMVFADYLRPSVRIAAMMGQPVIFVLTHDSIGVGEDGPTHQPVEQIASLRVIPGLIVLRPGDARETAAAWRIAMETRDRPIALALTRQAIPTLTATSDDPKAGVGRGAYVIADWAEDTGQDQVILIGTGSELQLALEARGLLAAEGIDARVVSMPSWDLFEVQPRSYQESVLPPDVTARVAVEAGVTVGWDRYVGLDGAVVGLDRFGASGAYQAVYEGLGISAERVAEAAQGLVRG
ncbi:MAG: transketolase [Chloroflexota bacterium]|nr:transketolase [Chloroflexota bacterium]